MSNQPSGLWYERGFEMGREDKSCEENFPPSCGLINVFHNSDLKEDSQEYNDYLTGWKEGYNLSVEDLRFPWKNGI